jgi:regulator of protease activity HflC (stomatin/prohibitin superfamily)
LASIGLDLGLFLALAVLVVFVVSSAVKVLREYERAVIFTLGRYTGTSGPGLILLIPVLQQMVKVDIRTVAEDVPSQDVISQDNVSVKVNAVLYYRIIDPNKAINQVEDFRMATSQLAQTTLRSVLGKHDLDEMLAERDKLNVDIQKILDEQTEAWGIKVANVEIKHVDLDPSMIRAIARQAEAERERRAKIISAEGEQQAAQKLAEAAQVLGEQEGAMQLRYLGTLTELGNEGTSTIVFPMPIDLLHRFSGMLGDAEKKGGGSEA